MRSYILHIELATISIFIDISSIISWQPNTPTMTTSKSAHRSLKEIIQCTSIRIFAVI